MPHILVQKSWTMEFVFICCTAFYRAGVSAKIFETRHWRYEIEALSKKSRWDRILLKPNVY